MPAQPSVSSNGVPVPESFQMDIAEILRTIGMHYVHQIAIPAIGRASGAPASINAIEEAQTVAIEDEPFDSVISETIRKV
jgi:hypothetical protein